MTVPVQNPISSHTGNGVTTAFNFGFLCLQAGDLSVGLNGDTVPTSQYAVSGLGQINGGTVTFVSPPASGAAVVIRLNVKQERTTNYKSNGDFFARVVNLDFDRLWLSIQGNFWSTLRSLRLGDFDADGGGAYRSGNNRIQDVADPLQDQDATNKRWVSIFGNGLFDTVRDYAEKLNAGVIGGYGSFLQKGIGAVVRTFQSKQRETVSVYDFGGRDDVGYDNTPHIQLALNSGARFVWANFTQMLCDTVEVPAGVTLYADFQKKTPLGPFVLVNAGSAVIGKLRGTGPIGEIEQMIFPARDGCDDVHLDVDVSNTSYGVHAMHRVDISKAPRRWTGEVRARDISGDGTQRGYGLLASPGHDFNIKVSGVGIPRHTLYLSNGSSGSRFEVHSDLAGYGDVQIASTASQAPCRLNKVEIFARRIQHPVGTNSFACNLAGKVENNEIHIHLGDSPDADGALLFRSLAANAVCRDNVGFIYIDGVVAGQAIVRSDAGVENTVHITGSGGTAFGAAGALIGVYNYLAIVPEGSYKYALRVGKIDYSASGYTMRGVSVSASYALTDIGQGIVNFRDFGAGAAIVDNTGTPSKITGWTTEHHFRQTVNVPGNSGVTEPITFGTPMPNVRKFLYSVIVPGVNNSNYPTSAVAGLSATGASVYLRNLGASGVDMIIDGVCRGY